MKSITSAIVQFDLPSYLACPRPTEERNLRRDEVRLLVSDDSGHIHHRHFRDLGAFLQEGDLLVYNTSATIPAAFPIALPDGNHGRLHFSNRLGKGRWLVEIRRVFGDRTKRWKGGEVGMVFHLPENGFLTLVTKYYKDNQWLDLWEADFNSSVPVEDYLNTHGIPIQYEKLDTPYPLDYYQTYFSFQPGSAEMPSAGRGFTTELVERLVTQGISFVPILLHTGVSSLEEHETPYPEYMEIDPVSAAVLNAAKINGNRIIAIGTTVVRALETSVDRSGQVAPYRGHTELYIDEDYDPKVVDGFITGFHEPRASHLNMLQAVAGFDHIERAYQVAIAEGYLWHQFGDLHLILPEQTR